MRAIIGIEESPGSAVVARDLHSALKSEMVGKAAGNGLEIALTRLQCSKDDIAYSLHAKPNMYTTYGVQRTDFLAYLGFERSDRCPFLHQCYATWVDQDFKLEQFAAAFDRAYKELEGAEQDLEACGFRLPQPEGWGFHYGREGSGRRASVGSTSRGDGHTSRGSRSMKATEDETFLYRFTFIETEWDKQFVTHYRPKHPPLSSEMTNVFRYLGLNHFDQCPEFDFEDCYFRTLEFQARDNNPLGGNVEHAHRCFDAHATRFASGIQKLLAANNEIEQIGMRFLPFDAPQDRRNADTRTMIDRPSKPATRATTAAKTPTSSAAMPDRFDVAISFARTERALAKELAERVKDAGYVVFYDDFYPEHLWGKNLTAFFDEIYRKRSRFCVPFVSKEYEERKWTNRNRTSSSLLVGTESGGLEPPAACQSERKTATSQRMSGSHDLFARMSSLLKFELSRPILRRQSTQATRLFRPFERSARRQRA